MGSKLGFGQKNRRVCDPAKPVPGFIVEHQQSGWLSLFLFYSSESPAFPYCDVPVPPSPLAAVQTRPLCHVPGNASRCSQDRARVGGQLTLCRRYRFHSPLHTVLCWMKYKKEKRKEDPTMHLFPPLTPIPFPTPPQSVFENMRTVSALVWASALLCVAEGKVKVIPPQDKIKHVVVLMEENRSFDHMCGFFPGVDGLKGTEYNLFNVSDPNSKKVYVNNTSPYVGPYDPDHSVTPTTDKIFGVDNGHQPSAHAVPDMSGFAQFEGRKHGDASSILNMFTPERLPIMSTLATEFNLFDKYFCSVPGPTWPNRLFQMMGTSLGDTATKEWDPNTLTGLYDGKTIFDLFEEAGYDWKFYFHDAPLEMAMLKTLVEHPLHVHDMERFKKDAKEGTLPTFSYMNPRWSASKILNKGASDQHPDHNVAYGEELMKEVYETLRAGKGWNNTLFIITYDEHGGFYDHVPTPYAPVPDNSTSNPDTKFSFNRTGVRIPTLMISPWVEKGKVIGAPENQGDSQFELTSIIKTMREMFGLGEPLTKRDAWAASFADQFLDTPRTDCPMTLPDAPKPEEGDLERELAQPVNHLQQDIIRGLANVHGRDQPLCQEEALPTHQHQASDWFKKVTDEILAGNNILHRKA